MVLKMLCREVIFKTNQSFSILKSDRGEKNFMFRGIGIHIFDQSQGCFKPVTIVMPSIKVCEPRIIFSRASMDQSWVMIVLFDDHFVEGFPFTKSSSPPPPPHHHHHPPPHQTQSPYRPSTATSSSLTKVPALLVQVTPSLWPAVWNRDSHSTQTSRLHRQCSYLCPRGCFSLTLSSVMTTDWLPVRVRVE